MTPRRKESRHFAQPRQTFHRALLTNLRAGFRAAFFRRVEPKSLAISAMQFIALALVVLALNIIISRTFYSAPVMFYWGGVRAFAFDLCVFLLVGWMATRFAAARIHFLLVPIALYAAIAVVFIVLSVAYHGVTRLNQTIAYWGWIAIRYGMYVWLLVLAALVLRRTARLAGRHVFATLLPLFALTAYDLAAPSMPLWYSWPASEATAKVKRDSPVAEEMLYLQPHLAEETINALLPRKRGIANLYFVGFAPYAAQDVFLKESEVIRTLMDERFGTEGRSMLLVNNDKALRRYPLATVTNLRAALRHIGTLINKEEDVVVIYLTSHGSQKHELSASYWPLRLEELTPPSLKQLLDEAGIKWRVIVVSACYSGGFIEPLHEPTALIMTAADATHTSFGCGAESDFTFFAKALFDEQLRETYSFEEAFRRAVPIIHAREKEERAEFSNPQIAMGDAIRSKLVQVERRLETTKK